MELRIKTGRVNAETGAFEKVTITNLLKISTDSPNISIDASSDNTVTISDSRESYDEWYSSFLTRKAIAMCKGGKVDEETEFETGIDIYTKQNNNIFLRSIAGSSPDANGNIQLLPGNTLDIIPIDAEHRISFEQISMPQSLELGKVLQDIDKCVWYLYHTYNTFIYRLNVWAPNTTSYPMFSESRMLGTIPSYQAVVAAWNMRVWRRSFLWDISPIRETISFNIGYMSLDCINPHVKCIVKIVNLKPVNDTTKFLTLYDQGVSTNVKISGITRSITKVINEEKDDRISLSGSGIDIASERGQDWEFIQVEIDLGVLNQGDYYKAAFSLAVAQNETTTLYYQQVDVKTHLMVIETTWVIDEVNNYGFEQEANVPALLVGAAISSSNNGDYLE